MWRQASARRRPLSPRRAVLMSRRPAPAGPSRIATAPPTLLFGGPAACFATAAASQPQRSARSRENDLKPVALHHRVTDAWQSGEFATEVLISNFGFFGR